MSGSEANGANPSTQRPQAGGVVSALGPNSPYWNPSSQQLRRLVLSYLYHHCYVSTAKVLAQSKNMDAILEEKANHMARIDVDGDQVMDGAFVAEEPIGLDEETLGIASLRREIREHILEGRIDAARQMLDVKFPSVLNVPPKTRLGTSSIPTTLQTPSAPTQTDSSSSSQQTTHPQSPFSLDPRHLSLNLHIQEFIESMRTIPLSRSYPASSSTQHIGASTFADGAPSIPLSDPETFVPKAQQLALLVSELPSALDRDTYSMELDGVSALMAYSVPESSPVSKYMGMERREAVAEQINSAILYRTNQNPIPWLQRYVEHTTVVWDVLHELGATTPPAASCPPGVKPPLSEPLSVSVTDRVASKAAGGEVPIAPFDFNKFVAAKP